MSIKIYVQESSATPKQAANTKENAPLVTSKQILKTSAVAILKGSWGRQDAAPVLSMKSETQEPKWVPE